MFDHVSLRVTDFAASRRFFTEALRPLGIGVVAGNDSFAMMGGAGQGKFIIAKGERAAGPVHVAFAAATREQVLSFHAAALAAGGTDNGAPGPRPQYSAGYYGAFVFDPDGNNIEAVCRVPDD